MNNTPTVTDLKKQPKGSNFYMSFKSMVTWGSLVFFVMLFVGLSLSYLLINSREKNLYQDIQNRLEIMTQDKSELVQAWSKALKTSGSHIASADVMRLFAAENATAYKEGGNDAEVTDAIKGQAKYFQVSIDEYVRQNKLASAYVVGSEGRVFLQSSASAGLTSLQKKYVDYVLETGETYISPLSVEGGQVFTVVVRPIHALDHMSDQPQAVATLVSTFVVTNHIVHFLKDGPLSKPGESTHILQDNLGVMQHIAFNNEQPTLFSIKSNKVDKLLVGNRNLDDFTANKSMIRDKDVFASTAYVHGTPFIILQEYTKETALQPLNEHSFGVHGFMLLTIVIVSALILLLINYLLSTRNRYRVNHQQQVLNALVKSVEIRDPYLSGHHDRVARTALRVANQMRLSIPERSTLYYAAMLSGVGKIFIPRKILTKPGKLTAAELKVLRGHIDHAMEVLQDMDFDLPIAQVIKQMYERIDGSGYPQQMKGADINFLSRILGACDVYCALTKPRAYRDALSIEDAIDLMEKEKDKYDKGVMGVIKQMAEEAQPPKTA
ncbi:MAG: HD domain-containing phosphohydrolase [Pseudomonadota bacterium]|nr:HD domain-containing phosphohydrolase [Pseudomonadota bacterium]